MKKSIIIILILIILIAIVGAVYKIGESENEEINVNTYNQTDSSLIDNISAGQLESEQIIGTWEVISAMDIEEDNQIIPIPLEEMYYISNEITFNEDKTFIKNVVVDGNDTLYEGTYNIKGDYIICINEYEIEERFEYILNYEGETVLKLTHTDGKGYIEYFGRI